MNIGQWLRYGVLGGIFLVPFIPLFVASGLYFPFITGKNFAFRILVEGLFAAWVLLSLLVPAYRPKVTAVSVALAAFVGTMALSTILAENPFKSFWSNYERMEGYITLLHLCAYILVLGSVLKTEALWRRFFHTSLAVAFGTSLYGVLQLGGALEIHQGGVRLDAMFGNAAYFAVYLLLHAFIALYFAVKDWGMRVGMPLAAITGGTGIGVLYAIGAFSELSRAGADVPGVVGWVVFGGVALIIGILWYLYGSSRPRAQWVAMSAHTILIGMFLYNLFATATRGTMLGCIAGVTVIAGAFAVRLVFRRLKTQVTHRRARLALSVGVVGVGAALVLLLGWSTLQAVRDTAFVQQSGSLSRLASISLAEGSTRLEIWNMAYQGFLERPVLGWGQENFNFVFNTYYDPALYAQESWFDRTHNVFLDWLIAGGILGLAGYLSLFAAALWLIWRGEYSFGERAVLTGLLTGYFVHNCFVFDNLTSYIVFGAVLAFVHATSGKVIRPALFGEIPLRSESPAFLGAASGVVIALVFWVHYLNVPSIAAAHGLIDALVAQTPAAQRAAYEHTLALGGLGRQEVNEQLVQGAMRVCNDTTVSASERQAYVQVAEEFLETLLAKVPNDARLHLFQGMLYRVCDRPNEAIKPLVRALELSPHKQGIMFDLGFAYLAAGNTTAAVETLRTAYELAPAFATARIYYAAALLHTGAGEEATELLQPLMTAAKESDDAARNLYSNPVLLNALSAAKEYAVLTHFWEEQVRLAPTNAEAHIKLAAAYLQLSRTPEAIAALERAMTLEPRFKTQGEQLIRDIRAGKDVLGE